MKRFALPCLLTAVLSAPALASETYFSPVSVKAIKASHVSQDPAPGLRTAQDALEDILDGRGPCRADYAREEVRALRILPGKRSEPQAVDSAGLRFDTICGKKVALLFYKEEGLVPEVLRETMDAVWLEGEGGRVVKYSEIEDHLIGLTRLYYRRAFNHPYAAQPTMLRSFGLFLDIPNQRSIAWRLESEPAVIPAVLRVNQGDAVDLHLVRNVHYPFDYANFTLEGYDVKADVSQTGPEGFRLSFVAHKAGSFQFFDVRSPGRIPGTLEVLPR